MKLANRCDRCPRLAANRKRIVWGQWASSPPQPTAARIMLIGEAPGKVEDRTGTPFSPLAPTGAEVRHLLWRHGLAPHTYITNMCKCIPPDTSKGNDPTDDELTMCTFWLEQEIARIEPDLIIAAGRFSSRYLLGRDDFSMDMVSGILYNSPVVTCPVLPITHPAIIFHSQRDMSYVMEGFEVAAQWKRHTPRDLPTPPVAPVYHVAEGPEYVDNYLNWCAGQDDDGQWLWPDVVAVDTEDGPGGAVWSIQISAAPGSSVMIMAEDKRSMAAFSQFVATHNPMLVIHSMLHDIPKLAALGIRPERARDTMSAAYLLQDEPLGLKPLAWRHANVKMSSYIETISEVRRKKALGYLESVVDHKWPQPDPVCVEEKGVVKVKQPQNITKKAAGIIRDVKKGKVTKDGPTDPRKRWRSIDIDEGRGMVEAEIGPMPDGYLADIPIEEAVAYACADADMTLRVYHSLLPRLQDLNMEHLLDNEAGVAMFVAGMIEFGMPIDPERFSSLADQLRQAMAKIEIEIAHAAGRTVQLSSHPQVSKFVYEDLMLPKPKKVGKKTGKTMTGDDILAQMEHLRPEIPLIRKWRKLDKLLNTYAVPTPKHAKADGRLHADFRMTNTDTGRLSCAKPNLMAQPKRNKVWAKELRKGFVALPGCVILSMDYSQIELRVLAEEAGEEAMIQAFLDGTDIHAMTASEMFDVPIDQVDKLTQRLPAKTINFGIVYGITATGLYRNMAVIKGCEHWTVELSQEYIDTYFERRPGIRDYIRDTESMARVHGRVWDWSGRIRRIPGARLKNEYYRAEALRQACNARIQTGAQSIIKAAMEELHPIYQEFRDLGWTNLSPLIQIHDDIVSMVPEDLLDVIVPVQKEIMENVKSLRAGVRVDVEVGRTWGEMEDWQ